MRPSEAALDAVALMRGLRTKEQVAEAVAMLRDVVEADMRASLALREDRPPDRRDN